MNMKVLITGVHGFVGSNLVNALAGSCTLYGLDIVAPEKEGVVRTFLWDELSSVPEVDAIIHLAGLAHDTKNQQDADRYFSVNTGLTRRIYDYFLSSRADRFIFFSTVKAVADRVDGVLTEDIVPSPAGPYGESKLKAEEYIRDHWPVDKKVYILRPCMIHGPGAKGNLKLLYTVVKKGIPWPLAAFENRRTFTSMGNLAFVVKGLLEKEVSSGVYNMGDDEALSTNELIAIICRALGKKPHYWRIPKGLMRAAASCGGALGLPLNPERLRKLTENYVSSNAKIKKAFGISAMPLRAEEGLADSIEYLNQ